LDASGNLLSEQRYLPFGGVRDDVGTITQTDFGYTSQRAERAMMQRVAYPVFPSVQNVNQPGTSP